MYMILVIYIYKGLIVPIGIISGFNNVYKGKMKTKETFFK